MVATSQRVLVFSEDGVWAAICLDACYATSGATEAEARANAHRGLSRMIRAGQAEPNSHSILQSAYEQAWVRSGEARESLSAFTIRRVVYEMAIRSALVGWSPPKGSDHEQ